MEEKYPLYETQISLYAKAVLNIEILYKCVLLWGLLINLLHAGGVTQYALMTLNI